MNPSRLLAPVVSVTLCFLLLLSANSLLPDLQRQTRSSNAEAKPLFLPKPTLVHLTTLGYDSAASDAFWFLTVNYFGKSFRGRGDFRWLKHYCSLTTELNPRAVERFEFCATLLSWMAKNPNASNLLLNSAIKAHPSNWRLYYLRAFNFWFFLNSPEIGAQDLRIAAVLPGAPPILNSLASRLISTSGDPQLAVDYLEEALARSESEAARSALSIRLRQALLSRDLKNLNELAARFTIEHGRSLNSIEELIKSGFLEELPSEPFGGSYLWDPDSSQIISTSGKKGLELPKKK